MNKTQTRLLLVATLTIGYGCDRGINTQPEPVLGPAEQAAAAAQANAAGILLSCTEPFDVPITTGGDTYFATPDCSGAAYIADGDAHAGYKQALSTFGCARDWDLCNVPDSMYSYYRQGDPNTCRSFTPDGSDFVQVVYNSSWTCCNDTQCSGGTPNCDVSQHQCVECYNDSQCSGSTPYCDTNSNTCVECTTSSQCGTGYMCSSGFCVCSPDPTCDGRSCSNNNDCGNGTCGGGLCRFGYCQCPSLPLRSRKG